MNCPKCTSNNYCKDGIVKGRQRYQCKSCRYRYTVEKKSDVKPKEVRRLALAMYLEGLGYRAIARILKVSFVSVFNWIKEWGEQAEKLRSNQEIKAVEIDELHTYVGQKKTTVGYGLLLIDMEKSLSLLCWDAEERPQGKSFGKSLKAK